MNFQGIKQMKAMLMMTAIAVALAGCSAGGKSSTSTTGTTTTATASDLIVSVDKSQITSTGSDVATVTVTAVDANRNVVATIPVTMTPDNNAVVATSATVTNTSGIVTGTVSIGNDHSNRNIDIVVTSGTIKKTVTVAVTGAALQASIGSATPGASATIQYHLVDGANNDMVNVPITVTLGSTSVSGTTDANGKYTFTYTVPSSPSVAVTAKAAGVETDSVVTPTSSTTPTATGTVLSASLAANPSNVQINTASSTTNQVEVRALFIGASNAPIQYARVRFDLNGDTFQIGGTLTSGTGYVYSDANGIARTSYIPGTRGSGNQALTIRACWSETDFDAGTCPNSVTAPVTVVSSGVSIAILTNGVITPNDAESIYAVNFAVQVVDSVGQPITGATVAGSIDLPRYYRGVWSGSTQGIYTAGGLTGTFDAGVVQVCDNEDVNRNDVLETYSNGEVEDANGTGTLEPFKASVTIIPMTAGSNVTDSFGKAYFTLQYGENYATWEDVALTFSATVQGTEGHNTYSMNLPYPSGATSSTSSTPPFELSPYNFNPTGAHPAPVNVVTVTDPASGKSANLCQAQH